MQDPEHPPINDSQDQAAEGTDIDTVVKQAQDARRMQEAFAVQPDKPVTDAQLNRLEQFQGAMDVHEGRIADREEAEHWGENYFIKSDKPLEPAQVETTQQNDEMEELANLFAETSNKEHQETAWKLFDEFVDKHNLTREEERARRNYLLGVSHEAPDTSSEAQPEPTPEPTPEAPAPDDSQTNEQAPQDGDAGGESGQEAPSDSGGNPEASPEGTEAQATTEAATPPAEGTEADPDAPTETHPGGEEGGGEAAPEDEAPTAEGVTAEAVLTPDEQSAEGSLDDDDEKEKGFAEKLKGMWRRVKSAPAAVAASIESYFTGGTPEENEKNRNVAVALGIIGIAGCIAIELAGGGGSTHEVSAHIAQGIGGAPAGDILHQGPSFLHAAAEHTHSSVEGIKTIQSHLGSGSDTLWSHAHEALKQYGAKVSNHNIFKLTSDILKDNHLTWESARHLPEGFKFTINPPSWVK